MKGSWHEIRRKRRVAMDAAFLFVVILLITQMWLLTATLELYLAGRPDAALPGLLISGVLFLACFALYRFVVRLDRAPEPEDRGEAVGPWDIR
jgi:phosphoglycerol transferase MdoB-like AlkP superfamily enzyme